MQAWFSYRCEMSLLWLYAYALLFLGFEYNIIKIHAMEEDKDAEMAFLSEEHSNTTSAARNAFAQVADKQSKWWLCCRGNFKTLPCTL